MKKVTAKQAYKAYLKGDRIYSDSFVYIFQRETYTFKNVHFKEVVENWYILEDIDLSRIKKVIEFHVLYKDYEQNFLLSKFPYKNIEDFKRGEGDDIDYYEVIELVEKTGRIFEVLDEKRLD